MDRPPNRRATPMDSPAGLVDPEKRCSPRELIFWARKLDELGRAGGRTRLDRLVVKQPNHPTKGFVPAEPLNSRPQEVTTDEGTSPRR